MIVSHLGTVYANYEKKSITFFTLVYLFISLFVCVQRPTCDALPETTGDRTFPKIRRMLETGSGSSGCP